MRVAPLQLLRLRAVLRPNHYGPGPHADGSSQDVHGKKGTGATPTSTSTTAKAPKSKGSRGHVAARASWRDIDGKTHEADVYQIEQFGDLPKSGGVFALLGGNKGEFLFSSEGENAKGSMTHGQMIRAVHDAETVDNYVRFYFTPNGLEFSVTSAAVEVSGSDWADRAVDNIYKSLDRMAAAGVPGDTPVRIKRGAKYIETTVQ